MSPVGEYWHVQNSDVLEWCIQNLIYFSGLSNAVLGRKKKSDALKHGDSRCIANMFTIERFLRTPFVLRMQVYMQSELAAAVSRIFYCWALVCTVHKNKSGSSMCWVSFLLLSGCAIFLPHTQIWTSTLLRGSGFRWDLNEVFVLLGCYAAWIGNYRCFGGTCRSRLQG